MVSLVCAAEPEKVHRWPKSYEGKQVLEVERLEAGQDGTVGFRSENYEFYSTAQLSKEDWRSIMVVCEGLRGAMRSLPLDLIPEGADGDGDRRRAVVKIFSEEAEYHRSGGIVATVGTYRGRQGEVLIWSRGLNEPDPEQGQFRMARSRQYDLLVHELCHQLTGREFGRLPIWFSEGLAEYMAAAHFAPGRYSFQDPTTAISEHVKKYLGDYAKKDRFGIIPLGSLLRLNGNGWEENTRNGTEYQPFLKYVSAVLLVHYFCHLDPERNHGEVVRNFLSALRSGETASGATVEELLRGRSLTDIEGEIETFWQSKGLRVVFRN